MLRLGHVKVSLTHAEAGKKGGQSRSDRKRASSRANLAAGRAKRWPGREINNVAAAPLTPFVASSSGNGAAGHSSSADPGIRGRACDLAAAANLEVCKRAQEAGDIEEALVQQALAEMNKAAAYWNRMNKVISNGRDD